ncbi:MAG: hypothetical protein IJ489_04790 [Clostridia bacterium]|nr:hypothetical protein [Clostridia bacterium]
MKAGAGFLSTENALETTINGQTRCTTMTPSQMAHSYTFNVSSDNVGVLTRISMAFTVPVTCTGDHEDSSPTSYSIPNLDLEIYMPNNTITPYVSSVTTNNVEIVEFYPTVAGTYTIKIVNTTPSTQNVYFGVAWHFD